jgi:hypothetical protein
LECFLHCNTGHKEVAHWTEAALMDPKLTILFLLIGCVVGLSHLNEENMARMRRQLAGLNWRQLMPHRRRS